MAQECGFFNAELEGSEYDRVYNAEQFAAYFASFIANGVFGKSMGELVVLENQQANMSVDVSSGQAWINGWWYRNTEELNLPIALADGVLNRKDIVVLRWGNTERDMWLQVLQGEPSGEPIAPEIVRNADYYDLKLCEIDIPAGSSRITQSQITDTRLDNNVCGLVTGVVQQIDTTELYLQFRSQFEDFKDMSEEEFNEWFDAIKGQISTDLGVRLQLEIGDLSELETENKDDLVSAINEAASKGGTPGVFYNTDADAEADKANIPEGSMVYTNGDDSIQDIIDSMTALHLAGSQIGAGTKNFTFNTEAQKRMLCITKKSGVIVESKEIPVDVLESGDVIPLGKSAPIIGTDNIIQGGSVNQNLLDKQIFAYGISNTTGAGIEATDGTVLNSGGIGLAADLSNTSEATITYNGNNSFTITVTDSTLSVYVYVDMLVLGGSASARNVSFDGAGTDLVSTDVEGAILELLEKIGGGGMPYLDYTNYLHVFTSSAPSGFPSGATYGLSFTASKDCYLFGSLSTGRLTAEYEVLTINGTPFTINSTNGNQSDNVNCIMIPYIKLKAGDTVSVRRAQNGLYIFEEK